jgi:Kef-type K+ transport system membrane component KefB
MEGIYFEITIIIAVAAVLTILFRFIKQPAILAYILTGILLGPLGLLPIRHGEDLELLGQVGITLLLFLLGLELKLRELRSIGKTAIIGGSIQVVFTCIVGMLIGLGLGFSPTISLYLAIGLSFSSTIIIVKLLSDKKDLTSMYGKLAIGILLMQDFFAVMTIILFTGLTPGASASALLPEIAVIGIKVILLFGLVIVLSKYVFPPLVHKISNSSESLFLFSLAWVFVFTAIVTSPLIGFSIEIGGFLAGLALANTLESFQIVARMKALRDFFITLFFVMLGLEMKFSNIELIIFPAIIFSLFVIFGKPLIVMATTGLLGYRKRTSFLTGISLSQISEFSLIIFFIGNN